MAPIDGTPGGIDAMSAPADETAGTPDAASIPAYGLLHSTVAGRTDHLQVRTPAGAYVIPADVVSGIGEGNTLAGSKMLDHLFETGPWNTPPLKMKKTGKTMPDAPKGIDDQEPFAKGGKTPDVPILGAGGEYILHPDQVRALGSGDIDMGHKILDKFVVNKRREIAKTMLRLPGPVKS